MYVIWATHYVRGHVPINAFLKSFDLEAHDGMGFADFTPDPHEAMQFESMPKAMTAVMQQPSNKPYRPDGQPNRPLRAFSMLILTTTEAVELLAERRRTHKQ